MRVLATHRLIEMLPSYHSLTHCRLPSSGACSRAWARRRTRALLLAGLPRRHSNLDPDPSPSPSPNTNPGTSPNPNPNPKTPTLTLTLTLTLTRFAAAGELGHRSARSHIIRRTSDDGKDAKLQSYADRCAQRARARVMVRVGVRVRVRVRVLRRLICSATARAAKPAITRL